MTKLLACKPEDSQEEQLAKAFGEMVEIREALTNYQENPTPKNRAEFLFEILDAINALQNLARMEYKQDEIDAGVDYVNSKNYVRGYLQNKNSYHNDLFRFLR